MANLPESDSFDTGVYQIETTDAVLGGAGGKANAGVINLANRTNYLKKRIEKMLTKSVAGAADVVLTATESNHAILKLTGVLTGNINVVVPVDAERRWIIYNNTSGNFSVVIKTAGGNGFLAPQGLSIDVYTDGVDVKSATISDAHTGEVTFFATTTPPPGWLKANGAAISRTAYAALFALIGTTFGVGDGATTFNLPDLRGEFIRGFDDGRGIDTGRVFGSSQSDSIKSHNHTPLLGQFLVNNTPGPLSSGGSGTNGSSSGVTGSTGGAETRPVNVALMACIKY